MTTASTVFPPLRRASAQSALKAAAIFWFAVTAIGQGLFLLYILGFYGRAIAIGRPELVNQVLPKGYISGDGPGNLALLLHIGSAAVIIGCGLLQLVPQFRNAAPRLHRWNGRLYVSLAVVTSLAGLLMLLTRGTVGGPWMHAGMAADALLVLAFAFMAVRTARARRFDAHRRWALRLFMVVSAVWFFRVGLMGWLVVSGGPVGFDPVSFRGPFLNGLAFAQYLLPLAVLELYLRANSGSSALRAGVTAALLASCTAALGIGVFGAAMAMWLPHL